MRTAGGRYGPAEATVGVPVEVGTGIARDGLVAVSVGRGVTESVGVGVGAGVSVAVGTGMGVEVGVRVAVAVTVGVGVGEGVGVIVGVGVGQGVKVAVGSTGVRVGVGRLMTTMLGGSSVRQPGTMTVRTRIARTTSFFMEWHGPLNAPVRASIPCEYPNGTTNSGEVKF